MEILDFVAWFTVIGGLAGIGFAAMMWAYLGAGSISVVFDDPIQLPEAPIEVSDVKAFDYLQHGINAFKTKTYRDAVVEFSKAIQAAPRLAEAYHNRGLAFANLRQDGDAARDLARASELYIEQDNQAGIATIKQNFEVIKARKAEKQPPK